MMRFAIAASALMICGAAQADTIEEKTAICAGCHGEHGMPIEKDIPIIWGQNEGYIYLNLRDFQTGARKDDKMTPIAQSLSKQDAADIAAYFAQKPWPATGAPAASKADTATAEAVIKAVVCTSCHLDQFQGDSSIARLADQQHDYLIKAMLAFRNRTRANNPGMSDLMNSVTPEQLQAMANYLAGF